MTILSAYLVRQMDWSKRTFGLGLRTVGLTRHIEKECQEIRESAAHLGEPHLMEWIDVIILAFDGYWRAGGEPYLLMQRLIRKQDINLARKWGPPVSEDEPSEHIREGQS